MTRVMITGARGLLGLNLALQAAETHTVIGVDKLDILKPDSFEMRQIDLLESGAIDHALDEIKPDWVIHCAALANVDACEEQPELAHRLNAELPGQLATETARRGIRLVHLSTDAVFDGARGDYKESDPTHPLSLYARTKLEGEQAVLAADPQAIVARVNFFGWSQSGNRSLAEFFFYNLSQGKAVNGFKDVYFCPLLANHLADLLLEMLAKGLYGLYHVVSTEKLSKYEFGVRLAHTFSLDAGLITPIPVAQAGLKAARSPNITLNTEKLTRDLGHPAPDVQHGLNGLKKLYEQGYPEKLKALAA
jgi:dTDP-4-dehydrorhamnose reductase